MIKGTFINGNVPIVKVAIGWNQSIQTPLVIVDTGFTGDLQVTPKIATELGLTVTGVENVRIANGALVPVPTATAFASMEGMLTTIQVLISESFPLVGISFLEKFNYKASIDCKNKTVSLERAN